MSSTVPLRKLLAVRDDIATVCPIRVILDCEVLFPNIEHFQELGQSLQNLQSLTGGAHSYRSASSLYALCEHTEFVVVTPVNSGKCSDVIGRMTTLGLNMVEHFAEGSVQDAITRKCAEKGTMHIPERTFVVVDAALTFSIPRVNFISPDQLITDMKTLIRINSDIVQRMQSIDAAPALPDYPSADVRDISPEDPNERRKRIREQLVHGDYSEILTNDAGKVTDENGEEYDSENARRLLTLHEQYNSDTMDSCRKSCLNQIDLYQEFIDPKRFVQLRSGQCMNKEEAVNFVNSLSGRRNPYTGEDLHEQEYDNLVLFARQDVIPPDHKL